MLFNLISILHPLTSETVGNIRSRESCLLPIHRKTGTNQNPPVHCIGQDAKQTLNQQAGSNSNRITEIAVTLSTCSIIKAYLSEITGAISQIHTIKYGTLHQFISRFGTTRLKISQCCMHYLSKSHIVNTPWIRQPIRGRNRCISFVVQSFATNRYMRDFRIYITCRLIGLKRIRHLTVECMIDGPYPRRFMQTAMSHEILIFGPMTFIR